MMQLNCLKERINMLEQELSELKKQEEK